MRFAIVSFLVFGALGACASRSAPAIIDPASHPPLPPSSGTPIGILLDDATRLHLRGDQLTALREIDASLAARNDQLDATLRPTEHAHDPTTTSNQPMRRGGGHRRPQGGGKGGPPPAMTGPDQATQAHAQDERTANTRDAIAKALALLDAGQRTDAEKLLVEHGVEVGGKPATQGDGDGDARTEPADGADGEN